MSARQRESHRKSEAITPKRVFGLLKGRGLTTQQFCSRTGLSSNGAENLLKSTPGVHRGKIGRVNLWSLE